MLPSVLEKAQNQIIDCSHLARKCHRTPLAPAMLQGIQCLLPGPGYVLQTRNIDTVLTIFEVTLHDFGDWQYWMSPFCRLLKISGKNIRGGIYKDPTFAPPLLSGNLASMLFSWLFRILTVLLWGGSRREPSLCQESVAVPIIYEVLVWFSF